jgi:hypothetical protein
MEIIRVDGDAPAGNGSYAGHIQAFSKGQLTEGAACLVDPNGAALAAGQLYQCEQTGPSTYRVKARILDISCSNGVLSITTE